MPLFNFGEIPSNVKFVQFVLEGILIIICCLMMFFSNGQSTIEYIDSLPENPNKLSINVSPLSNLSLQFFSDSSVNSVVGGLMKYKTDLIKNQLRIPYVMLFMYWVLFPLVCYLFVVNSFFNRNI